MMTIKRILQKYSTKELTADLDEKYAGGFWDYSYQEIIVLVEIELKQNFTDRAAELLQDKIYQALQETRVELFRLLAKQKPKGRLLKVSKPTKVKFYSGKKVLIN